MTQGLDSYLKALVRTKVTIDSASRVFMGNEQMVVHTIGGVRKVQLPNTQFLISLEDLVTHGAKVIGGRTPRTLALNGAEARWAAHRAAREAAGLPANVYVANARSIQYAVDHNRPPPVKTYIGRRQNRMTEVYNTVEEVVQAMNAGQWRTVFSRGRYAEKK